MKTLVVFIFSLFAIGSVMAQESSENGPVMTFEETQHEFGDIHQGDKVEHTFAFENTGNEPLVISNVQVTCGCTASDWPKDPIAPGQESSIKITFNSAGKMGMQTKVITIVSNASGQNKLMIKTNVLPKEDSNK